MIADNTPERTQLAHTVENPSLAPGAPATIRNAMMSLPVEQQALMLTEYADRRDNLRAWLQQHMVRGVHFGDVPGIRKGADDDNWWARPSLYKAGAEMLCDLMGLRAEFTPEHIPGGHGGDKLLFCFCAKLYDTAGVLIGEGRGAMGDGEKGMKGNSAIKMAQKRAHVDAVITSLSVADLFTQDYAANDSSDPATITEAQADALVAMFMGLNDGGHYADEIKRKCNIASIGDLPVTFFAKLKKNLEAKLEGGDA